MTSATISPPSCIDAMEKERGPGCDGSCDTTTATYCSVFALAATFQCWCESVGLVLAAATRAPAEQRAAASQAGSSLSATSHALTLHLMRAQHHAATAA